MDSDGGTIGGGSGAVGDRAGLDCRRPPVYDTVRARAHSGQYWQTPLFLAVNRRITWVWAAAFAVLVATHVATLFFSVPAWIDGVVTAAAFVYATAFTARYPEKARKAAGLQRAA